MRFSVIVPAFNSAATIGKCVESIKNSAFDSDEFEILVVDNGSTDGTADLAAKSGAKVLRASEPNRSRARNIGAGEARGDWMVFTDADCEVNARWLAELAAAIDQEGEGAVSGSVALLAGKIESSDDASPVATYIALRGWLDQEKFLAGAGPLSLPFAATANLAIRKDVFDAMGGFDEAMKIAAEDADLCWRAAAGGFRIHYAPLAKVVHHHRSTTRAMMRQAFDYGRGNAEIYAKYRPPTGKKNNVNPAFLIWAVKGLFRAPYDFISGRDPLSRRLGWFDFLANGAQAAGRVAGAWRLKIFFI